jgi:type IV pilus assembly protein PilY1
MKSTFTKKTAAYLVAACMAGQPAFAAVTDISSVPLGSSAGAGFLPNLLFILDDSGSMGRDHNPDYVAEDSKCMTTSGGSSFCSRGDPPYEAGGANAMNGVSYDPNFTYPPGLSSTGQPVVNPPSGTLTSTSVTPDAYLGGSAVNVTTSITDKRFCNANNVCRRSGADNAGVVTAAGLLDAEGHALGAGQFPYRTNASAASTGVSFGLPEMMLMGTFSRTASTVTATTITAHGLTTSDRIFVTSGTAGLNVTCVPVVSVPNATTFTYTSGSSGGITATTASYRKCNPRTFSRAGSVVTVTAAAGHFLVSNDIVSTLVPTNGAFNVSNATVTVTNATTYTYNSGTSGTIAATAGFGVRTGLYNNSATVNGPAVSYGITPIEWCRDENLTDCKEFIPPIVPPAKPTGVDSVFSNPAYVRFCRSQAEALAPGAVTFIAGTPPTPRCQLKFVNVTGLQAYIFPRYGWFNRDTIASTVASYANRPNRSDCVAAPNCTYAEEIQNYSKWYAYYRTRMQMMKTSAGRSFLPFVSNPTATPPKPDRLRVGFITINPTIPNGSFSGGGANVDSTKYLKITNFSTAQASSWYTKFYAIVPNPFTPLRVALSRAGWIFAGKLGNGLTAGIPAADDPVQASCQKNYSFLTTDGFWNQGGGQDLAGNAIGNLDNVDNSTALPYAAPDFFVSRAGGSFDGAVLAGTIAGTSAGGSGTLADIALYYFKTDLRNAGAGPTTSPSTTPAGGDVSNNNVSAKTGSADFARHQHMNTYTIGLADGLMRYQADYATATTGDFANIKNAAPATGNCFWATGTCNWPSPQADGQSALDDLWHAAVNGRGAFYSAVNPNALATGLSAALNSLDVNVASAAAAATSSPQVAQGNARAFSTTYQTSTWAGEIYAQGIDPQTGEVIVTGANNGKFWEAHKLLLSKVSPSSDTRVLKTLDVGPTPAPGPSKLKDFAWTSLSAAEKAFFLNKCTPLSNMAQCNTLTPAQLLTANNGSSLVGFLRGQTGNEATVFRDRTEQDPITLLPVQTILGDIINAQPVAVRAPFFQYENETAHPEAAGETYPTFRKNNASRSGPLLIGANDGFLHAFDPGTGVENWGYAPRFLLPSVYQLADSGYPGQHRYFVDGSPEVADVFDATAGRWKTIVVGGTNSGGRGYYALDITDPVNPLGMWEFCSDATLCPNDLTGGFPHSDADLGFSYGNPVIGRRALDGKWVVILSSGLNNIGAGTGQGYFYVLDAMTGQILHKVSTGVGDTTTPSGLMKMGGYYPDGLDDPNFTHVYGGDQLGNVWRLDMAQTMLAYPAVTTGAPAVMRLATLKDAAGRIQPITARPAGTHIGATRIYYVGTGRYLGNSDLTDPGAGGIAWQQSIYGIRDNLDSGVTPPASFRTGNVVRQTLAQSGANRTISKNPVDWTSQDGFFIDLNPVFGSPAGDSPGERVVLDLRLIQGTLLVTSNVPAGGACVPGGTSFQYGLDFKTGGYVGNDSATTAGVYISQFLVGAAIEQTADNSIKALNKTITGENLTTPIPIDIQFAGKRFSYRER